MFLNKFILADLHSLEVASFLAMTGGDEGRPDTLGQLYNKYSQRQPPCALLNTYTSQRLP